MYRFPLCSELKSASLRATQGKSVSILSSEAGLHRWEDAGHLPLESVPSLWACVLRSVVPRNAPLNPYTSKLGGGIRNLADPVTSCVGGSHIPISLLGNVGRPREKVCLDIASHIARGSQSWLQHLFPGPVASSLLPPNGTSPQMF